MSAELGGWVVSVYFYLIPYTDHILPFFFLLVWIPTDRWEYFIRKYCKVLLHWEYTTTYYCQHFQILSIQKDKNFKSSEACNLYEKWRSVEILQMEHHRWLNNTYYSLSRSLRKNSGITTMSSSFFGSLTIPVTLDRWLQALN